MFNVLLQERSNLSCLMNSSSVSNFNTTLGR